MKQEEKDVAEMNISNFILYWSSDEDERDRMHITLKSYMEEVY